MKTYMFIEITSCYPSPSIYFYGANNREEAVQFYQEREGNYYANKESYLNLVVKELPNVIAIKEGFLHKEECI